MPREKDGWDLGATTLSEEVVENLLDLQNEALEKARLVRNCHHCTATWREISGGRVTRCGCYREWKSAMITLRVAIKKAKEKREEWETDEMFDLHSVNPMLLDDCVDPEKMKTLRILLEHDFFVGIEPPYMEHFEMAHERRMKMEGAVCKD